MSRRSRRRRRRSGATQGGLLAKAWSIATDLRAPGLLLLACGIILLVTPWTRTPDPLVVSWWDSSTYLPDAASVAAGFGAAALVLLLGVLLNRYRLASSPSVQQARTPDESIDAGRQAADIEESGRANLAWAGVACLVSGIALVVGYWFVAQQDIGAARVPIAIGQTIEHYTVPMGGQGLKVNLPMRVRLSALDGGDEPVASVQIFEAGETPPSPQKLPAGAGLELDDLRLTFTGMKPDAAKLRAVFASDAADTIKASAGKGESFRVSLDGDEYKVLEVSNNYMGVMGPAAKVRAPKIGEFWVFQRAGDADVGADLGHHLRLEAVQTQPAAVLTIARKQPFWPISLGGTLFILGFALLIVFPERIVWVGDDRRVRLWSFNEAGRLAEQTRLEAGAQVTPSPKPTAEPEQTAEPTAEQAGRQDR